MAFSDSTNINDYILRNQADAILWKCKLLLSDVESPLQLNDRVADIARTLALIPHSKKVMQDDYIIKICKEYKLLRPTLIDLVDRFKVVEAKKKDIVKAVHKNTTNKIDGEPKTFMFFTEKVVVNAKTNKVTFKGVDIQLTKFVQLIEHFGFTRYSTNEQDGNKDGFRFVRLMENIINEVEIEEIKDFIEDFIIKDFDYQNSDCEHTDAQILREHLYQNMTKVFNKSLFARARTNSKIIINKDTATECFLYFKNGFVRVTKEKYELLTFDKMNGSVWQKQMLERDFAVKELLFEQAEITNDNTDNIDWDKSFSKDRPLGDYADFIWKISGEKKQRFVSMCSIIGYLLHDFYDYKLKCIFLTDSSVTETSDGRTGKTLSMQMLGHTRSYCEVNGKQFDQGDQRKYETADLSTQILHVNDLTHKGKYKFDFELMFNDITEGYQVRQMFKSPFRQRSKIVISSNKTIFVQGSSMRDRILEFEVSAFFGEQLSPVQYYGKWMGKGWNESDWISFDNFLCFCVQNFFTNGLVNPESINLEARVLLNSTSREFLDFMNDMVDSINNISLPWEQYPTIQGNVFESEGKITLSDFRFDKNLLMKRFTTLNPDFDNKFFSQKKFTDWLRKYAKLQMNIATPLETRGGGFSYFQFVEQPLSA